MSDKSPLFLSALELIAHATELYSQGMEKPRNYKFAILHLANAIELILKDCMIDKGASIYDPNRSHLTITIWEALKQLDKLGVQIQERPVIELLIDDRNTLQHRFGFPNSFAVSYYLEHVIAFFKRFLLEHYNVQLREALANHLAKEHLSLLGLTTDEQAYISKLAEVSPQAAVIAVFNDLIKEFSEVDREARNESRPNSLMFRTEFIRDTIRQLQESGYLPKGSDSRYNELRLARNHAAHAPAANPSDPAWQQALEIANEIRNGLQKAREAGFFDESNEDGNLNA